MSGELFDLDAEADEPLPRRPVTEPGVMDDMFTDLPTSGGRAEDTTGPMPVTPPRDDVPQSVRVPVAEGRSDVHRPSVHRSPAVTPTGAPAPVDPAWRDDADPVGPPPGAPAGTFGMARGPGGATVEDLLRQAIDVVASARRAPLSASVLVAREELLDILQEALALLPDEVRQARRMLREREEFLAQRQREADELIETVRAEAQRMVQRSEITRQARHAAQRIVEEAREEARRLRHGAEDFCDQKLAAFEIVLERTARTVRAGRERLAQAPGPVDPDEGSVGGRGPSAGPAAGGASVSLVGAGRERSSPDDPLGP
jgi:hypothetical protein